MGRTEGRLQNPPAMADENRAGETISKTASEESILQDAARIDAAADTQGRQNPLDKVLAGEMPAAQGAAVVAPVADPAIAQALTFLVGMTTTLLHVKQGWDDPGEAWKIEVGRLGAVLIDRYLPNFLSEQGEIVALVLMVGTYAAGNILSKAPSGSDGDTGAAGKRENDFVSADAPGKTTSNTGHS